MARKVFEGNIVSTRMQKTVVVEVKRRFRHAIYKKIIKRTNRIKADTAGRELNKGDFVKIQETSPISRDKHFKVTEVIKEGGKK